MTPAARLTGLVLAPIFDSLQTMSWLEQKIRRYEHARWTTDDNRRVFPFEWGLEHIGGRRGEADPRGGVKALGEETRAPRRDWLATHPPDTQVPHPRVNG